MKGTLVKTEQGWMVEYAKHSELPLHPDQTKYMHLTGKKPNGTFIHDGNEVEFEIVERCCTPVGQIKRYVDCKGCDKKQNYAKLILFKEQQLVQIDQDNPVTRGSTALVEKQEKDVVETMARDFYWSRQPKGKFMAENSRPDMVIGYVEGYNRAKEDLFTEKQVREAIVKASLSDIDSLIDKCNEIIQSLKQPKKD